MRKFTVIFSTLCLSPALTIPASAAGPLEYIINGLTETPSFGGHTKDNRPYLYIALSNVNEVVRF